MLFTIDQYLKLESSWLELKSQKVSFTLLCVLNFSCQLSNTATKCKLVMIVKLLQMDAFPAAIKSVFRNRVSYVFLDSLSETSLTLNMFNPSNPTNKPFLSPPIYSIHGLPREKKNWIAWTSNKWKCHSIINRLQITKKMRCSIGCCRCEDDKLIWHSKCGCFCNLIIIQWQFHVLDQRLPPL